MLAFKCPENSGEDTGLLSFSLQFFARYNSAFFEISLVLVWNFDGSQPFLPHLVGSACFHDVCGSKASEEYKMMATSMNARC